jgi:hypothetical protein
MDTELLSDATSDVQAERSGYIPVWVFCLLSFLSFGLYDVYWFVINWRYIRDKEDGNYNAVLKGIFPFIFGYSLFRKFYRIATENGYKGNPPLFILLVLYITCRLFVYFDLGLISMFAFVFLIPVIQMMNFYYLAQPNYRHRNGFTKGDGIFLAIVWGIIILLIFVEVNTRMK